MGFLLRYPKLIGAGIALALIVGFGIHYKLLTSERDQLRIEKVSFQLALKKAALNMEIMTADAVRAAEATITAARERDEAHAALDEFRAGREADPEAHAWGEQQIPSGEVARLCIALPEMAGCEE